MMLPGVKGPRARPVDREGPIVSAIVHYLRTVSPNAIVTHVVNERPRKGRDAAAEIARAKMRGMLPGFPDVVAALPGGVTLFIEVKAKTGLSSSQKEVRDALKAMGHHWLLARSVDDVAAFLKHLNT